MFEAFTMLAALAEVTRRARLGQMVTCAGYRNPACWPRRPRASTSCPAAG